jgi:hypothetical protein
MTLDVAAGSAELRTLQGTNQRAKSRPIHCGPQVPHYAGLGFMEPD